VIAVLGGLGAAVAWATTMLTASRASPLIGSWSTLAWVMLTGLLVVGPVALVQGHIDSHPELMAVDPKDRQAAH